MDAGRLPHRRAAGTIVYRETVREVPAVNAEERAAYEAAMTENQLLRAVLDDLKAEGCAPASMSNARKTALGERLRAATGLPLREITAFSRISRSSYEYHRSRLGHDRAGAGTGLAPARRGCAPRRICCSTTPLATCLTYPCPPGVRARHRHHRVQVARRRVHPALRPRLALPHA